MAFTATNISGKLTAIDTRINPTATPDTPNFLATGISESVNQSAPFPIDKTPNTSEIIITANSIF